jgi:hypothetical protein
MTESKPEEGTPLYDEIKASVSADQDDEVDLNEVPENANAFKVDVQRALEKETQDGKGDEDPGPSDFLGFATDGVEKETGE